MATETSSAVGNGYVQLGGTVDTVLSSPRIAPPPATLEEARNQPGRREKIEELTRKIESEGIKYVFFQQVSITGRVMGKGVVASFFPQVAERGYQLVYGATANLFTDRHGNYIGFGPEESELAAVADLDTFKVLPWDPRVARVFCDCYDTETGELLDADCRQNLKNVSHEFEQELGLQFLIGIEPEMMWLKRPEDGQEPEGVTKPYCYHIHHFTLSDENGNNVFHDPDGPAQLSEIARFFLGGMLEHFPALMCIGNPTVNSYVRMWDTGFWAPIYKNWGWQNRTTTVRVASGGPPWAGRAERPPGPRRSRATRTTSCRRARRSRRSPTASARRSWRSRR